MLSAGSRGRPSPSLQLLFSDALNVEQSQVVVVVANIELEDTGLASDRLSPNCLRTVRVKDHRKPFLVISHTDSSGFVMSATRT